MTNSSKVKSDLDRVLSLKTVSFYKKAMGIIWCVGALIILEFLLNDEPFAIESRLFYHYYIWTIPFFIIFQDRKFVCANFCDRKWIWVMPYIINTCFLALNVFVRNDVIGTDFGFPPLVRECCCVFFWIMSIPLTIINNDRMWTLYAVAVYVNSIIYYWVLMNTSEGLSDSSGYILFNVAIILISYIISMTITYYNFRQITKMQKADRRNNDT